MASGLHIRFRILAGFGLLHLALLAYLNAGSVRLDSIVVRVIVRLSLFSKEPILITFELRGLRFLLRSNTEVGRVSGDASTYESA